MFLGSGLLVEFLGFLKFMCLYIEVPKTNVDTFSDILNFISLKRGIIFVLGLGLRFLSKINILWRIFLDLSILLIVVSLLSVLIKDLYLCDESLLHLSIC